MLPLLLTSLASLAYGLALGGTAGAMAKGPGPGAMWSRKVFHVGIFTGAVPAHLLEGFWGVVVYGSTIGAMVLLSTRQGVEYPLQGALTRSEKQAGSREDILIPLFSTALGGLVGVLLVGTFAVVGYLVCGWGDAAGEVVGRRWGRHRYGRPLAGSEEEPRSVEGSLAVFVAGTLGGWVGLVLLGFGLGPAFGIGMVCGAVGSVAEGMSGRGTDNFWVQLLPALTAWWFLG